MKTRSFLLFTRSNFNSVVIFRVILAGGVCRIQKIQMSKGEERIISKPEWSTTEIMVKILENAMPKNCQGSGKEMAVAVSINLLHSLRNPRDLRT